jgi:hypothetical protein
MFDDAIITRHAKAASEAMVWGRDDCCQWVRAVVLDHGGPDIMEGLPPYGSRNEAMACMAARGGFVRWVMAQADWLRCREQFFPWPAVKRLVGIVPTHDGPGLALFHNGHWIMRAKQGVVVHPAAAAVLAWEIGHA